jgi:hypothetical protein
MTSSPLRLAVAVLGAALVTACGAPPPQVAPELARAERWEVQARAPLALRAWKRLAYGPFVVDSIPPGAERTRGGGGLTTSYQQGTRRFGFVLREGEVGRWRGACTRIVRTERHGVTIGGRDETPDVATFRLRCRLVALPDTTEVWTLAVLDETRDLPGGTATRRARLVPGDLGEADPPEEAPPAPGLVIRQVVRRVGILYAPVWQFERDGVPLGTVEGVARTVVTMQPGLPDAVRRPLAGGLAALAVLVADAR